VRIVIFLLLVTPIFGQTLTLTKDQAKILEYAASDASWYVEDGILYWDEAKSGPAPSLATIESWRTAWETEQTKSQMTSQISTNNEALFLWTETLTEVLVTKGVIGTADIPKESLDALNQRRRLRGLPPL